MMESLSKEKKKASLTDLEEGTCLTFPQYGTGSFLIGLSAEDKVCMVIWEEREKDRQIVVELFRIDQSPENVFHLTPVTSDLPCSVSRNFVRERQQLLKECKIEIGDKVLKFSDGGKKPRKLPPTPGVMILPTAPPKPRRNNDQGVSDEEVRKEEAEGLEDSEDADDSWQYVSSPEAENDPGQRALERPDQIASVAASHVVRQMMLYTDLKMSVTMMDELYRAFQNVVEINREMLYDFLEESKKEMEQNKRARSSGLAAGQPLHGPVIELLVELLKHSLDPVSHVILWLLFLRTLSHFTQNMKKMVSCQAAAAIMGSMAVYLEVPEVQQFGLEILCKLATYQPESNEKAPVRETGVEMIIRAMKYHDGVLAILRPACRALANLASTVSGLLQNSRGVPGAEREDAMHRREELLSYVHKEAIPVVQDVMCSFPRDLGVQMESRRLLAVFAPEKNSNSVTDLVDITEEEAISLDDSDIDGRDQEEPKPGILKSARSFENLRSPRRKVQFTAETVGGSLSNDSIFLESAETSGHLDSGSGRFMDSFGNEMDMPDSATYIGEENMFFPETPNVVRDNKSMPPLIYVPSCSGADENSDQSVSGSSESQSRFDTVDAEMDNNVNQLSEAVLNEKSSSQDSTVGSDSSMQQPREVCELPPVVLEPPPPVPPRQAMSVTQENDIKRDRTKEEVQFLTRLMRSVITGHICSLVLSGEDSQALQAIDQPLESLLQSAKASDFLLSSMAEEYSLKKSLMDIDPVMVISIIDAVRYRSLTCDLLKSSLTELLSRMSDKLNPEVCSCAFDSIYLTIADANLEPIFLEKKFIRQMIKSLPDVQEEFLKQKVEELQAMLTDLL